MATPRTTSNVQQEFEKLSQSNPNTFPSQVENLFTTEPQNREQMEVEVEPVPISEEEIQQRRSGGSQPQPQSPDQPQNSPQPVPISEEEIQANRSSIPPSFSPRATESRGAGGVGQPISEEEIRFRQANAPENSTAFGRGLATGIENTKALATQAAPAAIAELLGEDEYAQERFKDFQEIMARAQTRTEIGGDVKEVEEIEDPGDFGNWLATVLGEQVPNIAGFIVSGGAGTLAGGALKAGAKKFLSAKARSNLTDEVRKKAQKSLTKMGENGALAGGVTYGTALGTGEIHGEQLQRGGESNPAVSLAGGALIGALDVLPLVNVAAGMGFGRAAKNQLFQSLRSMPRGKRTAALGALTGSQEMGTEAAQEVINLASQRLVDENFEAFGEEGMSRILNAAAAGLAVGGTTGAGGGLASRNLSQAEQSGAQLGPGDTFQGETVTGVQDVSTEDDNGNTIRRFQVTTDIGDGTSRVTTIDARGRPVSQRRKERATAQNRSEEEHSEDATASFVEDQQKSDAEIGPAPDSETGVAEVSVDADGRVTIEHTSLNQGRPEEPQAPGNLRGNLTANAAKLSQPNLARPNPNLPGGVITAIQQRLQVLQDPSNYDSEGNLTEEGRDKLNRASENVRQTAEIDANIQNPIETEEEVVVDPETPQVQSRQETFERRTREGEDGGRTASEVFSQEQENRSREQRTGQEQTESARQEESRGGLTREEARAAVADLEREFPGAPPVTSAFKEDFASRPNVDNPAARSKGLFIERADGSQEVFLIADNINSAAEAQRVYLHEVVGHAGLRGIFTESELDQFLQMVGGGKDMTIAEAEERVARLAEGVVTRNDDQKLLNRVISFVRQVLRKIIPNLKFSNAEIREFLRSAATHQQRNSEPYTAFRYFSPQEKSRFTLEGQRDPNVDEETGISIELGDPIGGSPTRPFQFWEDGEKIVDGFLQDPELTLGDDSPEDNAVVINSIRLSPRAVERVTGEPTGIEEDWINLGDERAFNLLGTKRTRAFSRLFARNFPEASGVMGMRVGGTRRGRARDFGVDSNTFVPLSQTPKSSQESQILSFQNMMNKMLDGVNPFQHISKEAVRKRVNRSIKMTERERDALDLALRRMPEHQITWSRVAAAMEELMLPLSSRPDFSEGRFRVEGGLWGGAAEVATLPDVPVMTGFQREQTPGATVGARQYATNRALREFHRHAAARGHLYARIEPQVDDRIKGFARKAFGGKTLEDGSVEWKVRPEEDDNPQPTIYIKASDMVRQQGIADALNQPKELTKEFLSSLYVHGRSWQLAKMKFGRLTANPLQLEKLVKIPEFTEYLQAVQRWQRDKVKWLEEAERLIQGGDDSDAPAFLRLSKEQRSRIARAIINVSEESDKREIRNRRKNEDEEPEEQLIHGEELDQMLDNEGLSPDAKHLVHEVIGIGENGRQEGILRRFLRETVDALKFQVVDESLPASFTEQEKRAWLDRWNQSTVPQRVEMLEKLREVIDANPEEAVADPGTISERLDQLEDNEQNMLNRNYFPRTRFGKYAVRMRTKEKRRWNERDIPKGGIAEFITYESSLQRDRAIKKELQKFADKHDLVLETSNIPDEMQSAINMPPELKDNLAQNLQLNDEQRKELDEIFLASQPGRSFLKHMLERDNVGGFSEDVERVLASYLFNGASHLASSRHRPKMRREISNLKKRAKNQGENTIEMEMVEYMQQHEAYLSQPGEEFINLRGWGFNWFLGASPRAALVNLTQLPLAGYPWAAARYGDSNTVRHLGKAMKDARSVLMGKKKANVSQEEQDIIQALIDQNVIDQSQVSSIAGFLEGGNLQRMMPNSKAGKTFREVTYWAGFMFHQAEVFNRNAMALAVSRMERERGTTDFNELVERTKEAIQATQFEYNRWNRPKMMRGLAAPLFLFKQHIQNMAFLSLGGEGKGTAVRAWGMLISTAGLLGIPFMEDALDVLDFIGTNFKETFGMEDPKVQSREYIRDVVGNLTDSPDLVMNGLGRYYGLGPVHLLGAIGAPIPHVDITSSISMGDVIPGTEVPNREGLSGKGMAGEALEAVGGPVAAMYTGIYTAVFSESPYFWKRIEQGMPRAFADVSKAIRTQSRGREITNTGATFVRFPNPEDGYSRAEGWVEALFRGAGFSGPREAQKWDLVMAQKNAVNYWMTRRGMVMENFSWAQASGDKEGLADVRKSVRKFNASVPYPSLKIGSKHLRKSLQARRRRQAKTESGLPNRDMFIPIYGELQESFPEVEVDVRGS